MQADLRSTASRVLPSRFTNIFRAAGLTVICLVLRGTPPVAARADGILADAVDDACKLIGSFHYSLESSGSARWGIPEQSNYSRVSGPRESTLCPPSRSWRLDSCKILFIMFHYLQHDIVSTDVATHPRDGWPYPSTLGLGKHEVQQHQGCSLSAAL